MKYIDEFRDPQAAQRLLALIRSRSTRPVRLMEFCGGHTHAILKFGLRQLLPSTIQLLSGPGCPVCVTSSRDVDTAIAMAHLPDVIMTTFGDMIRVPGSRSSTGATPNTSRGGSSRSTLRQHGHAAGSSPAGKIAGRSPAGKIAGHSLQSAKAQGADVRMVYSTLDALSIARSNPDRQVIFLGIGFETTAPTVAAAILQAQAEGLDNFSVLPLNKLTPPATRAILDAGEVSLAGIIGPGHVTTVIGSDAWQFLPQDYGMPCAIAGFEPLDILQAVHALVDSIERDAPAVTNAYTRSVRSEGNRVAQRVMHQVFEVAAAEWRGLGTVPGSGLSIRDEFAAFDATRRFPVQVGPSEEPPGCLCGEVLRGVAEPSQCPLFARVCTEQHPVGPCMVSGEGACAAHMRYGEG